MFAAAGIVHSVVTSLSRFVLAIGTPTAMQPYREHTLAVFGPGHRLINVYCRFVFASIVLRIREQFVVEEIMNDSILIALETYGLVGAQGEGSEAELNTDMNEMITVRASA